MAICYQHTSMEIAGSPPISFDVSEFEDSVNLVTLCLCCLVSSLNVSKPNRIICSWWYFAGGNLNSHCSSLLEEEN